MADYKNLKTNELLFNEGDVPDNMYIVKSGKIAIFVNDEKNEKIISEIGMGELIGELALFDKKNRSAGARALCDTWLVVLPYDQLEKQLSTLPEWVKVTMKSLCDRLRSTNQKFLE